MVTRIFHDIHNNPVEVHFIKGENAFYLSQKDIATLFEKSQQSISKQLQNVLNSEEDLSVQNGCKMLPVVTTNGRKVNKKCYNISLLRLIAKPANLANVEAIEQFIEKEFNWRMENKDDYEILRYNRNNFSLDVRVSPKEETIWLSLNQIASLFERDKSVISRHIKNILSDKEVDGKQVVAKNATIGCNNKKYDVTYYNLDMILAVGYRVNSSKGIEFRKWANQVLKEYLLKGYALDNSRAIITHENYSNLVQRVINLENKLEKYEKEFDYTKERFFKKKEQFDAYVYIQELMKSATKELDIIDPYFDLESLGSLTNIPSNITINVYLSSNPVVRMSEIRRFVEQYHNINVRKTNKFHDRFIIIDKLVAYHLGTSLNHPGKRSFMISKIETEEITSQILKLIEIAE